MQDLVTLYTEYWIDHIYDIHCACFHNLRDHNTMYVRTRTCMTLSLLYKWVGHTDSSSRWYKVWNMPTSGYSWFNWDQSYAHANLVNQQQQLISKQIIKLGWSYRRPLKHLTWSAGTSSAISSTVLLYVVLLLFMIGSRHMRNRPYINIRPNTTITNIITTCKIH